METRQIVLMTEMYQWLEDRAKRNGTTVNHEIMMLIANEIYLERKDLYEKSEQ